MGQWRSFSNPIFENEFKKMLKVEIFSASIFFREKIILEKIWRDGGIKTFCPFKFKNRIDINKKHTFNMFFKLSTQHTR